MLWWGVQVVDLEVLLVVTGCRALAGTKSSEFETDLAWRGCVCSRVRNTVLSVESLFSSEQSLDTEMNGH